MSMWLSYVWYSNIILCRSPSLSLSLTHTHSLLWQKMMMKSENATLEVDLILINHTEILEI